MNGMLGLFIALVILMAGCIADKGGVNEPQQPQVRQLMLSTPDGWNLPATEYTEDGMPVILLHHLNGDRSEWDSFARQLQLEGYHVLAFDFRGHGGSMLNGEQVSWQRFTPQDFVQLSRDVEAAHRYLDHNNISLIGASVGANVALRYAAAHSTVGAVVALSPGEDYLGVKTLDIISSISQPLLLAASSEDGYAASSSRSLERRAPNAELEMLSSAGHGTQMLSTGLDQHLIAWLAVHFPSAPPPLGNETNVTLPSGRRR